MQMYKKEELLEWYKNNRFNRNVSNHKEYQEILSLTSFLKEDEKLSARIYCIKNDILKNPICKICGNKTNIIISHGNYKFPNTCSKKCLSLYYQTNEFKNKQIENTRKIHGKDYYYQTDEFKEKAKETCNKKYGGIGLKSIELKEKVQKTCVEKYGVESYSKTKEFLEKMKNNNLNLYGKDYYYQTDEFKEKAKETCNKKYGVTNITHSPEYKLRSEKTCQEKYNNSRFSGSLSHKEIVERKAKKKYEKYNVSYIENLGNSKHLLRCKTCGAKFSILSSENHRINNNIIICPQCNPYQYGSSLKEIELRNFIKDNYKGIIFNNTKNIIKSYNHTNLELDIYLPEINVAFEFNGDLWHANPVFYKENDFINANKLFARDIWKKDKEKNEICIKNGIKLITVWENDWINDRDKVLKEVLKELSKEVCFSTRSLFFNKFINKLVEKDDIIIDHDECIISYNDILISFHDYIDNKKNRGKKYLLDRFNFYKSKNKRNIQIISELYSKKEEIYDDFLMSILFGKNRRIYARKCEIRKIEDKTIVNDFCNLYHLQGEVGFTIAYGLYYNEELVEIMSFVIRNKNENYWEISRLCSKSNIVVIGGANKLWKRFLKDVDPIKCITYSDISLFSGNVYRNMFGLIEQNITKPNYYYINNDNVLNRQQCQVKYLHEKYEEFVNLSEVKIMTEKLGYNIIENCGNYKFVYEKFKNFVI